MKPFTTLAATLAALAAISSATTADASVIDAKFSGTVASQVGAGFAAGAPIAGEFVYDTATATYRSFVIGGQSVSGGFGSTASVTPDRYSAIYRAQLSPVSQGGGNSTFIVDLEGINPWSSFSATALLLDAAQLATNLDTSFSNFGFYMANADGTGIRSVNATLSSINVAAVPEPTSVALLLIGAVGLVARRGKQRRV